MCKPLHVTIRHEAVWDVDIYSKQVSPHDTLATELILPTNTERTVLPDDLTGPGTRAGASQKGR